MSPSKQKQQRRDYLRRLTAMKQAAQENPCRAWIACIRGTWHYTGPDPLRLRPSARP